MTMRSRTGISLAVSFFLAWAPAAAESSAVLVRDLAPGPPRPRSLRFDEAPTALGGQAFFATADPRLGEELWATDGTPRGTRRVADLCPGRCSGEPQRLTPSGDLLFFVAGNTTTGENTYWVWRSDGTDDGTFPLADLKIDAFGSVGPISYLAAYDGGAVFVVRDGVRSGYDLWRTDGTRAGTKRFFDLPGEFGFSTPSNRRHPYLEGPGGSSGVRFDWQNVPWVTDGTAQGTHPVADLPIRLCQDEGWIGLGDRLIYAGGDDANGCEPWTTDGTPAGTRRLRDLNPGAPSSFPFGFVRTQDGVYFSAQDRFRRVQIWKTDGTTEGTIRVRTPRPERPLNQAKIVGAAGSRVYFAADDGVRGLELWKTDGNPATTQPVADLSPGPAGSQILFGVVAGDGLYFVAVTSAEPEGSLFFTQGTVASTVRIPGTSKLGFLSALGDRLLLAIDPDGEGSALAVSDGSAERPRTLLRIEQAPSSSPANLSPASRGLLFTADDGVHGREVWRTEGRRGGTIRLAGLFATDRPPVRPPLFASRGGVFISLDDFGRDSLVAWSDGGAEPPRILVHDPSLFSPRGFVETGEGVAFFLGRFETAGALELWGSDGTPERTGKLAVVDEEADSLAQVFATAGPDPGTATFLFQSILSRSVRLSPLFSTDGTAGGTRALAPLGLGNHTQVLGLLAAAGRSFLVVYEEGRRSVSKLWVSDGTPSGTGELFRINDPFAHSFINEVAATESRFFFTGDGRAAGRELWVSDGTREGTHRVADLAPGNADASPSDLFGFGNLLFFCADDGTHGRELWITDGTVEGTRQIEIRPGPRGSYPQGFARIGDRVVFAADDGIHGQEVWETDGTPAGTRLLSDVLPGPDSSAPTGFALFGTDLLFAAGRPNVGNELFRVPGVAR